jgi:hypothetical protein
MKRFRSTAAVALLGVVGCLVAASQVFAQPAQRSIREFTYITYRAPAPPLAACTTASADDGTFLLAGWKMLGTYNLTLSTYKVPSSVASGFGAALNGATGEWEATDVPNVFGSVTQANVRPRQRLDGQNVIGFAKGAGGAVGITRFWIDTSTNPDTVVEFDVLLSSNFPWSTTLNGNVDACSGLPGAFDVQAVLTHELGHPVGLEHVTNDAQTMYAFVATGETRKRTLASGDTTGVNLKYP